MCSFTVAPAALPRRRLRLRACLGLCWRLRILASGFLFRAFLALAPTAFSGAAASAAVLSALRFRARHSHRSRSLELLPLKSRVGEPAFLCVAVAGAAKANGVEDGPIACALASSRALCSHQSPWVQRMRKAASRSARSPMPEAWLAAESES